LNMKNRDSVQEIRRRVNARFQLSIALWAIIPHSLLDIALLFLVGHRIPITCSYPLLPFWLSAAMTLSLCQLLHVPFLLLFLSLFFCLDFCTIFVLLPTLGSRCADAATATVFAPSPLPLVPKDAAAATILPPAPLPPGPVLHRARTAACPDPCAGK